jgi:hypothetical protein
MLDGRVKTCPVCLKSFETRNKRHRYCSDACRARTPRGKRSPGSTIERGYGKAHKALREKWAPHVAAGIVQCHAAVCVMPLRYIVPGEQWDLGHTADRTAYTGPEHRRCNRRDGAVRGNRQRSSKRVESRPTPLAGTSRQW